MSPRLLLSLGVIAVGLVAFVLLILLKKRNYKNFLALGGAVLILLSVVLLSDIQSADDYYSGELATKADAIGRITLSITCEGVAEELRSEYIPANGLILPPTEMDLAMGDTVFDLLTEAARAYRISVDHSGGEMPYVRGIAYLYEYDFGDLSGWMFYINGEEASVGCGEYRPKDGDVIEWRYTRDWGDDLTQ